MKHMNVDGYEYEGTGGNCTALVRRDGDREILLTDDLAAPQSFPCEAALFVGGEFEEGQIVGSLEELRELERRWLKAEEEKEFLYFYTRAQAIADGVLVDVSDLAKEAGFKLSTCLSAAVNHYCTPTPELERQGQSFTGRVWDVLNVLRFTIATAGRDTDRVHFNTDFLMPDGTETVDLWTHIGPGDEPGIPVLTIMLQGED